MPFRELTKAGLAIVGAASILLNVGSAGAGMDNQDTGEQCWGGDCSDMDGVSQPSSAPTGYVTLPNVSAYDCNDLEVEKIDRSVRWLQDNMALVDAQMGQNGLMDWPGNSRENFVEKLDSELKFYCINHKRKCRKQMMLGIAYPAVAPKRVNLCTANIREYAENVGVGRQSLYVEVVAHEVAHLVRINGHRNVCADQYFRPRFSQALGLAAEAAHRGITYDPDQWYNSRCSPGGAGGMDVVNNKLQSPPE